MSHYGWAIFNRPVGHSCDPWGLHWWPLFWHFLAILWWSSSKWGVRAKFFLGGGGIFCNWEYVPTGWYSYTCDVFYYHKMRSWAGMVEGIRTPSNIKLTQKRFVSHLLLLTFPLFTAHCRDTPFDSAAHTWPAASFCSAVLLLLLLKIASACPGSTASLHKL